jgi:ATP-dependent DNA ligase|nr:MAG TPA: ATP-dependent DNA ligase [Caudoviricetes sp.]
MFDKEKISEFFPGAEDLMIQPMLIWTLPANKKDKLSEICASGEYFATEKIDGALYQFCRTDKGNYLFGRTVSVKNGLLTNKIDNVPHIDSALSCLPCGTVIVGEIYVPGGTSKNVTSIMGCLPAEAIKRQDKQGKIKYYLYDMIFYNGEDMQSWGAEARYQKLVETWNEFHLEQFDFLRLAESFDTGIEERLSQILAAGGEGIVLKKKDAPYSEGKRPAWATIKCKQMDTIDLVCTRAIEATKEYTGKELETWPYWQERSERDQNGEYTWLSSEGQYYEDYLHNPHIYRPVTKPYFYGWKTAIGIGAYDDEGNLKEIGTVSSGLTDEMRAHLDNYVGKVVALQCMSIDRKEKTLRHPIVKAWRDDKNAAECKLSEVFS